MSCQNAAIYIRVSTEEQTEFSPDAQLRIIKKYCTDKQIGFSEEHIYRDEGISGRRAEARPQFMKMVADAKRKPKPFDVILVHKFDRFARNREDSVVYKSFLRKECGVKVVSVTEHMEDDKFSVILESMLEAMAEYYSLNLGDEVKKGMTEKALRGELQTPSPFGYGIKDGRLIIDEKEAQAVKTIFKLFACEQMTSGEIAKYLNAAGILTKRGNLFKKRSVDYIIKNPVYIGYIRWNPSERADYTSGKIHSDVIIAKGGHDTIIDEKLWHSANERINKVRKSYQKKSSKQNLFSGILKCAKCGGNMYLCGKGKSLYRCGNYLNGKCASSQGISSLQLESIIKCEAEKDFSPFGFTYEKELLSHLLECILYDKESDSLYLEYKILSL